MIDFQPRAIRRWEIATGKTSVLEKGLAFVSNDENWLARRNDDGSDIETRPVSGATWRTAASNVSQSPHEAFTPDCHWVFYTVDDSGKRSLCRLPVTGGAPERLGDDPSQGNGEMMSISPDGKKILAVLYQRDRELSILENFVPKMPNMRVRVRRQ